MVDLRRSMLVLVWMGISGWFSGVAGGQAGSGSGAENSNVPTLFVVGNGNPAVASSLGPFLDLSKIHLADRSAAGNGVRSMIDRGTWAATLAMVRPGDFVLIEFARSGDSGAELESLPGVSDDARGLTGTKTPQSEDAVQSYGWYLRRYAIEAIARGATPILAAPVMTESTEQSRDEKWTEAIAVQQRIAFVDVPAAIVNLRKTSVADGGAAGQSAATPQETATAVVAGLKGLAGHPVAGYFSAEGNAIAAFRSPAPATEPPL